MKKVILKCLKMNRKIKPDIFVKRFKKLKTDF